ncbi:hypothetical protein PVK06_035354 [Gossypium arboreum]|uniref:Uncharacterized protein n=1 Tax=Gossypium arboreum TaxID=29729 RepID=A0ABR0NHI7_GOSAR|nr:hypothetical protein PVK06_035354 [Gossypium arboreum]
MQLFGHLAQTCYYRYSRDEQSSTEDYLAQQGVSTFGGSRFPTSNGQNWNGNGGNGQNWPNVGIPNVDPRGPRPMHDSFGPTLFVPNGGRPPNNGFHAPIGPQILGQQIGNIGGTSAKAYGPPDAGQVFKPCGSVRPRLNDGPISSEPNVNCVNLDRHLQYHAPTVPWRTKPRACVFDVDSSSYDSSQFIEIPQLPEFHASDFSDATAYDSNFSGNDSAVAVAANPVLHSKFKHVELDLFFVREKVAMACLWLVRFRHVTRLLMFSPSHSLFPHLFGFEIFFGCFR